MTTIFNRFTLISLALVVLFLGSRASAQVILTNDWDS
jgi:hypothetical protein